MLAADACARLVPRRQVLAQYRSAREAAPHLDVRAASEARSMREFDGAVIAPMMGELSAAAYYESASAINSLDDVRVPLLFVSAQNDMIAPAGLIDRSKFAGSGPAPLLLVVTAEGGHSMVWPEGWGGERSWACEVLVEWVRANTVKRSDHVEETAKA